MDRSHPQRRNWTIGQASGPWNTPPLYFSTPYDLSHRAKTSNSRLSAYSGTHSGSIEGIAELKNPNQAFWRENHQDEKPPFLSEVVFNKEGDKISVSAKNTEYYGGAGIHFDEGHLPVGAWPRKIPIRWFPITC